MSKVVGAETLFAEANALFVDEEYQKALKRFNQAIELEDTIADYFSKRSFCHYKLQNYTGEFT